MLYDNSRSQIGLAPDSIKDQLLILLKECDCYDFDPLSPYKQSKRTIVILSQRNEEKTGRDQFMYVCVKNDKKK